MNDNPMGMTGGDQGDPGDENDSKWQQCEQDIETLEQRVSAIEAKVGISSPADEPDAAGPAKPPLLGLKANKPGGKAPFFGSYS